MKRGHNLFATICLLSFSILAYGQQEEEESKWDVKGYVKNMTSVTLASDCTLVDNLIHNRFDIRWYPTESLNAYVGVRNRMFFGDQIKIINDVSELIPGFPSYGDLIDVDNDFFDLSVRWVDNRSFLFHTIVDRAYLQWIKNDWEVTLGRQRVNWGTNLVWNPNDIFNAYSYFDFDYEERPAVDAIRVQKYTGFASTVEVVVKAARDWDDFVAAGLWKVNKGGYDFQFLGGYARRDITLGAGWAGNIKSSGFKGEMTYFIPTQSDTTDFDAFLTSLTWDLSFKKSSYIMASVLFNSAGSTNPTPGEQLQFTQGRLTAKELSPYMYSLIFSGSYQFTPLINGSIGAMTFPGSKTMFLYPVVTFSLVQNLDLDVIAQLFVDQVFTADMDATQVYYLRLKWSF